MGEELPVSYLPVFRFSRRPGTAAADMPDQVHPETISRRSQILRDLAEQKNAEFCRSLVGTFREAVIEAESGTQGWRNATTDNYVSILVPGDSTGAIAAGSLADVEINEYSGGKLFASVREIIPAFSVTGKGT